MKEKEEKQNKDCIFCKIARGEIKVEKILETENFFAIKDLHPKTRGHVLVIPKKHFLNLLDLPSSLYGEMLETAKEIALNLMKQENSEGFNLIMNNFEVAGQKVMHAHLHILPRYDDNVEMGLP